MSFHSLFLGVPFSKFGMSPIVLGSFFRPFYSVASPPLLISHGNGLGFLGLLIFVDIFCSFSSFVAVYMEPPFFGVGEKLMLPFKAIFQPRITFAGDHGPFLESWPSPVLTQNCRLADFSFPFLLCQVTA